MTDWLVIFGKTNYLTKKTERGDRKMKTIKFYIWQFKWLVKNRKDYNCKQKWRRMAREQQKAGF